MNDQMEAHQLTRERVRHVVSEDQSGFYRLGYVLNGRFHTTYVGRSDTCLQRRLLVHVRESWQEAFVARPAENKAEAYRMECLFYHLEQPDLGNKIHPGKPDGVSAECPYCLQEAAIANSSTTTTTITNAD
ncbi:hypothetical protein [Halorubrum aidingense]|nr:hypothetical protein [Halorubrum aidingense]